MKHDKIRATATDETNRKGGNCFATEMAGIAEAMEGLAIGGAVSGYPLACYDYPAVRDEGGAWVYHGNPNTPPTTIDASGACTWENAEGRLHRGGGGAAYIPQEGRDGYFIDGVEFEWGDDEDYLDAEAEYVRTHPMGRLTKAAGR
jgi:hypothetical protein